MCAPSCDLGFRLGFMVLIFGCSFCEGVLLCTLRICACAHLLVSQLAFVLGIVIEGVKEMHTYKSAEVWNIFVHEEE